MQPQTRVLGVDGLLYDNAGGVRDFDRDLLYYPKSVETAQTVDKSVVVNFGTIYIKYILALNFYFSTFGFYITVLLFFCINIKTLVDRRISRYCKLLSVIFEITVVNVHFYLFAYSVDDVVKSQIVFVAIRRLQRQIFCMSKGAQQNRT